MKYFKFLLILLIIPAFTTCREDAPDTYNPNDLKDFGSWSEAFESYWDGMNYGYAFWSIDPTDWDEIYRIYKPKFDSLGPLDPEDSQQVFEWFNEITANLIDHHYGLLIKDPYSSEMQLIRPGENEIKQRDYYHEPMSLEELKRTIDINRDNGRITNFSAGTTEVDNSDLTIISYNIDNGVIYIYISAFSIYALINKEGKEENPAWNALLNFFDLIDNTPDIKGIIIDVRGNGGGYLSDIHTILGYLIPEDHTFGYSRTKNGMGRLDYTPWAPWIVYSQENGRNITAPIISLADIHSVSMSEMITMAIKSLPNGYFVGERTCGGLGTLMGDYNYSYAGTFQNQLLMAYTTTTISKDLNGNIYEGKGIPPTIEALFNKEAFASGIDTQLERALESIRTGN